MSSTPDVYQRKPYAVNSWIDRLAKASQLPRIRLHDLRHSHVAHLIAAGVHVETISKRIGHASASFTLDRYGHLFARLDDHAADAVGDAIFGAR